MLERPTAADGFAFAQPEHGGARRTYPHVPSRLSQSFRSLETLRFAVVFVAANEILELPYRAAAEPKATECFANY
jgi:hypothetical protein